MQLAVDSVNLKHFFALVDIARLGRIGAAARSQHMSQSALTQALGKLEQLAGTALFVRTSHGMLPTAAGQGLIRRAERAIDLLELREPELRGRAGSTGGRSALPRNVTSRQLRALIAVVDTGSFTSAAQRLELAQPTVHRAARDLEATIGSSLFARAARGVTATAFAQKLARRAALVFAEIRQGFEELRELAGANDSRIAVGALPLLRSGFLPTAITRLLERYPDAQVSVVDGPYAEQLNALQFGRIDWLLGALRQPRPGADVVQIPLFDEPLAVVVRPGHPLLRRRRVDASTLARLGWIAPRRHTPARHVFDAYFTAQKTPPPTRIVECSSLVATRGLVAQSDRAALLSPLQVREDVAAGTLALLVAALPTTQRAIGVTVRADWAPTTVQREFGAIVAAVATELKQNSSLPGIR